MGDTSSHSCIEAAPALVEVSAEVVETKDATQTERMPGMRCPYSRRALSDWLKSDKHPQWETQGICLLLYTPVCLF